MKRQKKRREQLDGAKKADEKLVDEGREKGNRKGEKGLKGTSRRIILKAVGH